MGRVPNSASEPGNVEFEVLEQMRQIHLTQCDASMLKPRTSVVAGPDRAIRIQGAEK